MILRHNRTKDVTAKLQKEVCSDIKGEISYLKGEELVEKTANKCNT